MICICTSPGCLCSLFYVPEEKTLLELLTAKKNYQPEQQSLTQTQNLSFTSADKRPFA